MTITVTSLRLRSLWHFFKLSWHGLKITMQTKKSAGFIQMKNTGLGYMHYTITAWESEEAMKNFMRTGAHAKAMTESAKLSTEIVTYTYESDIFPSWKKAKEKIKMGRKHSY